LVGVAVKVTEVPAQIVVADATILTEAFKIGFTVIITLLEVAGFPVTQVNEEVNTTVTTSLLDNELVVNVGLLVPTGEPLTRHW
jgi:hypothetical protein